ncbi:hypothetical protein C1N32_13690 [Vibrio diazotrophicus]|uniref:DUF3265 domain-containing protein n=1 Tax=Vibrio diazotrophicus TaxID=685 RepID=A0A2J8HCH8_VIBDI|nr:hypothetical protein C1O25_22070 [Vibrio diazotrophicus]PNI04052.1 hypothetical protein C1N32_13690 [Vibrio diazotrophicus]
MLRREHCVSLHLASRAVKLGLTNALRRIRNAWHFYHALILVIKVVCIYIVLRCSPLKRALAHYRKLWSKFTN